MLRRGSLVVVLALSGRAFAQPTDPGAGSGEPPAPEQPPATEPAKPEQPPPSQPTAPDDSKPVPEKYQPHELLNPIYPASAAPPITDSADAGFKFGSYGRVSFGSDLRGGKPERVMIVAHGPRIVEPSYLELELSYGFVRERAEREPIVLRPIITVAFNDTLFHETGEFDAQPALRNMYLDAKINKHVGLWCGSRMYRGDDIYLFDYWPLDDQNMVGAGGVVKHVDELTVAAAVGANRLEHPFQHQEIEVPNPVQGATTVEQLNRQRIVASASGTYVYMPGNGTWGAKAKVHGEFHTLPSGTRKRDDGTFESLPHDTGTLVGLEVGAFEKEHDGLRRHLNGFVRYAKGLASFDELAPPTSFGPELKTNRASELTFGLSGNYDHEFGQLMLGALSRRFIDADADSTDPDDGWEYALDARPLARIVPDWYVGADISYQARFPRGLNPITLRAEDPAMFQIAPMIAFSPMGPSAYDRPQLRAVFRAAHLNEAALDQYVPDDPRHANAWVYFLGVQAEWWFNSTTYR